MRGLKVRPRNLLAKGGITSFDVATLGMGIKRAIMLRQILPCVSEWRSGHESLFPGNVGVRMRWRRLLMGCAEATQEATRIRINGSQLKGIHSIIYLYSHKSKSKFRIEEVITEDSTSI